MYCSRLRLELLQLDIGNAGMLHIPTLSNRMSVFLFAPLTLVKWEEHVVFTITFHRHCLTTVKSLSSPAKRLLRHVMIHTPADVSVALQQQLSCIVLLHRSDFIKIFIHTQKEVFVCRVVGMRNDPTCATGTELQFVCFHCFVLCGDAQQ